MTEQKPPTPVYSHQDKAKGPPEPDIAKGPPEPDVSKSVPETPVKKSFWQRLFGK